jgi:hypothetical protein
MQGGVRGSGAISFNGRKTPIFEKVTGGQNGPANRLIRDRFRDLSPIMNWPV